VNKKVLFVDDEMNVLNAVQRNLRGHFDISVCDNPKRAAEVLRSEGPFAVLVSDMRMPGMNGVELLASAREIAPDTVRVMLTGNADQRTAIEAVNKGEIFRFLNKPADPVVLKNVLTLGIRQFELVSAEKELLEQTLNGSVKVLAEILSIVKPEAFGRTDRLRAVAKQIARRLDDVVAWELDTAASLALLGCVGLRSELLEKVLTGSPLSSSDKLEYVAHPLLAADLIKNIPRLANVADTLLYQHKHFDGSGFPMDERKGEDLPIGSRILHLVLAYDELKGQGASDAAIYENLRRQQGRFDPRVLDALRAGVDGVATVSVFRVPVEEVKDGMTIQEDVKATTGTLLVCNGQVVTPTVRAHLTRFHDSGLLTAPLLVSAAQPPSSSQQPA
jgi:response regulator RpfG family c-di-GMP phosphodiesterase